MDDRKVFTIQKLKIKHISHDLEVDALVSEHGAKRIYHESNLPAVLLPLISGEVEVEYKEQLTKGHFIKETTFDGIFYNLKFTGENEELKATIRADVKSTGVDSPWQRKYARIAIQHDNNLTVPFMAVYKHGGSSVFLQVKNFTLGGLLLDYSGDELEALSIGSQLKFDLLTNNGDSISDIEVMVMHVSQDLKCMEFEETSYQFGVKIIEMSSVSEKKYRDLIRDYCLGLQNQKK